MPKTDNIGNVPQDTSNASLNVNKVCFVLTPIGDDDSDIRREINGVIENSIKPALHKNGYTEVTAAHNINTSGRIDKQIIDYILDADLVIANLTNNNANVMYELAIRHYLQKPVIHIAKYGTKLPFDIQNERTIFYKNDIMGSKELQANIETFVTAETEFKPENIIAATLETRSLKKQLTKIQEQHPDTPDNAQESDIKILANTIEKLLDEMNESKKVYKYIDIVDVKHLAKAQSEVQWNEFVSSVEFSKDKIYGVIPKDKVDECKKVISDLETKFLCKIEITDMISSKVLNMINTAKRKFPIDSSYLYINCCEKNDLTSIVSEINSALGIHLVRLA